PVVYGFVNGLAIVIFMAQIPQFKDQGAWLPNNQLLIMLALCALTMAIMYIMPKITTKFPAPLASILIVSAVVISFEIDTKTVGDMASIKGGLPIFHIPEVPFSLETLKVIFPYSLLFDHGRGWSN